VSARTGLAYATYERAFARPFEYGGRRVTSRSGVLLRKRAVGGDLFSEASPLPGHSTDTLEEILGALGGTPLEQLLGATPGLPPSLRFGLEGFAALESPGHNPVASNALLRAEAEPNTDGQIERAVSAAYAVCKVKIRGGALRSLFELIRQCPPHFRFRLDANAGLSRNDFSSLCESLREGGFLDRIDYVEEPFPGVWEAADFRDCGIPLAADESAPSPEAASRLLAAPNPPSVFVVKPTVAGGLFSLAKRLDPLRAAGKRIVFTSALEAEAGRRALLAFLSLGPSEVAGLSTGFLYDKNFLADRSSWKTVPEPDAAELAYYESLRWKECR
jgi:O-succinylbenzoate synthase